MFRGLCAGGNGQLCKGDRKYEEKMREFASSAVAV